MKITPAWRIWAETEYLVAAFAGHADKIRFVGGAVRDALLGIDSVDVDLATIFKPEETIEILQHAGIRAIPTGIAYGTITALVGDKSFEITTLRHDTSCDGRHADVEFTDDWGDDASRRDFTMNAMYLSFDGELFDYFGGEDDARAGRIRFIGDARLRIAEDYLRILRFFRFYAYYGKDEVDKVGLAACAELASGIANLSGERLQSEMLKILAAPEPFYALELMQKCGVLRAVLGFLPSFTRNRNVSNISRLALLLLSSNIPPDEALKRIATRWKISTALNKRLSLLITNIGDVNSGLTVARQKQLIRRLGTEVFVEIVRLKMAIEGEKHYPKMLQFASEWQPPIFTVTGSDLIAMGVREGRELGEKLRELEEKWEKSDYQLAKAELLSFIAVAGAGAEK